MTGQLCCTSEVPKLGDFNRYDRRAVLHLQNTKTESEISIVMTGELCCTSEVPNIGDINRFPGIQTFTP